MKYSLKICSSLLIVIAFWFIQTTPTAFALVAGEFGCNSDSDCTPNCPTCTATCCLPGSHMCASTGGGPYCYSAPDSCIEDASVSITEPLPSIITAGQYYNFTMRVTNTGDTYWYDGSLFQFWKLSGGMTPSPDLGWLPYAVPPSSGTYVDWRFGLTAPSTAGSYVLNMQMYRLSGGSNFNSSAVECYNATPTVGYFGGAGTVSSTVVLAPTASCSVSPNPTPYGGNPGITLTSTNGYYCYVYNDGSNVSTGYFTSGTYYPGAQITTGTHQGSVYCYNSAWTGTGWNTCSYTVSVQGPTTPTITGATSGYAGTSYTYTFTSTDPNSSQVRYGVDWNMDSVADVWLPSSGYVNSGTAQSTTYSWSSTGTKTFKVLAQNYQGINSSWQTYTVSISSAPITGVCGTANKTYSIGATSYGTDTYCSAGTASASPTFPAAGNSVTWYCTGSNGGSNSPTCTVTVPQDTFSVTTSNTTGGSVESADNAINCGGGGSCVSSYTSGNTVTLEAIPSSSYWRFVQWTGDCSGTNPVCTLSVTSAKSATAIFGLRRFTYQEF
jgi:hypothetical protein